MVIAEPPAETTPSRPSRAVKSAPKISKPISGFFSWFLPKYLRRNFHVVGLLRRHAGSGCPAIPHDEPLIVALNHPSWWDPLLGLLFAKHCFENRQFYAPIDASALANYRIFEKLGFYGVDLDSASGAKDFLETSRAILNTPATSIWLTPEGRFTDIRDDAPFEPGLGHLLSRTSRATVLPLAAEYTFWEEKLPVALGAFGEPIRVEDHPGMSKEDWTHLVRSRLRSAQAELAEASIARDESTFESVIAGRVGVGGIYDWGRRVRCLLTGQRYQAHHSDKFNSTSDRK